MDKNVVNWSYILDLQKNSAVLFRVDASEQIGSGHVMRCLTLADELRKSCDTIIFFCRELPGNMIAYIEARGYQVFRLSFDTKNYEWLVDVEALKTVIIRNKIGPDWLIVDHYGLDKKWESALRPFVNRIMVIDDLANREHDCDLILDQNYYQNYASRYQTLVPDKSRQLLGPKYALLRKEFKQFRRNLRIRDGIVRRILVFYGGSDPTNETVKALKALEQLNRAEITVDVVVGGLNPNKEHIKRICAEMVNINFYCQIDNMAELMSRADLALGAGGITIWERCYLGLPSLVTMVAANQRETTEALANAGAVWNLGWHEEVTQARMVMIIEQMIGSSDILLRLSKASSRLFE